MILKDLNKRFKIIKTTMCALIFLLLFASILLPDDVKAFGFDSANSCTPNGKLSRRGRAQMIATIPCDLSQQAFCHLPGSAYPWHAVRRFVHENQGLMKRMYGDVRHISILRDEIQINEIDIDDVESATNRYTKDAARQRSAKYMIHNRDDFFNYKTGNNNDVLMEPHFRPVTSSTTTATATTTTTTNPTAMKSDSVSAKAPQATTRRKTTTARTVSLSTGDSPANIESTTMTMVTNKILESEKLIPTFPTNELSTRNDLETSADTDSDDDEEIEIIDLTNIESNSVYAPPPPPTLSSTDAEQGGNIQIIESPHFELHNLTSMHVSKISTTLKITTRATPSPSSPPSRRAPIRRRPALQNQHQQQQQQQVLNKVNLTILKESSNAKSTHSTTMKTTSTATATTSNTNESERTPGTSPALPTSYSEMVKGAQHSTTTKATSSSALSAASLSPSTSSLKASSSTASLFRGYAHTNGSNGNFNSNTITNTNSISNNRRNHINNSNTPTATTTNTVVTIEPSPPPSPISSSVLSLNSNSDIVSAIDTDKQHKPQASGALSTHPSVAPTTGTKPVLHDGQLYQDTMKQETPPVLNARGVNACPVKEEVVAPFWANNTRGEVLALLNLYPFEQYVHWEKCTHEHKQMYCRDGCRCEQQYRLHRLLAYDPHNECRGIFSDWFRFPSSCICKCYDIPLDFRATSRSPRSDSNFHSNDDIGAGGSGMSYRDPIDVAEAVVKNAIYEHATEEWYRPREEFDLYDG